MNFKIYIEKVKIHFKESKYNLFLNNITPTEKINETKFNIKCI